MDRSAIEKMIPHRFPFLFIDRIEELEPGIRCVARMFLDSDDAIFCGHFPARPILPGVLMIEAVGQTAAVMMAAAAADGTIGNALLASVNRFKFLKPVAPGQDVRIETTKLTEVGSMAYIRGTVYVDGAIVASGELSVVCA
ncbi:MAG TPA: 3-hydroxyacyl-ACP dehydratase FabZ [Acidobacteriaceae bacterium]|nr:3-hydroxyacyl-ACP dehydratase FabZ [Acidobacteriaceae bacterium]